MDVKDLKWSRLSLESMTALLVHAIFAGSVSAVLICNRFCQVAEPLSGKTTPDSQEGVVIAPKPAVVRGIKW